MKRSILIGLGLAAMLGSTAMAGDNDGARILCNGRWTTTGNAPPNCYENNKYNDHRRYGRNYDRRRDRDRRYDRDYDNRRRDSRYEEERYYRQRHDYDRRDRDHDGERILHEILRELIR